MIDFWSKQLNFLPLAHHLILVIPSSNSILSIYVNLPRNSIMLISFLRSVYFQNYIKRLPCFKKVTTLPHLCQQLMETTLGKNYYLTDKLIRLILTLPVSTATTERAFSRIRIIKNRLRSTIGDEFLADCMIFHIKRDFDNTINNASIIEEFKSSQPRMVKF